ncbi:hypothetical protein A2276_00420 [candidate division WOR-1 bacterium RIFOXYA12_FULL_43_27]|uniref:TonB-dependent receptor n=1 Tax=candidate division WOR-1 bacterium RIFOXYC2_FULL_46_14 TaxID=1802587 RepID=A0A1F4U4M5_UNCSA|nr:MAG: hypothetical protein A2276_00420 [candidate division WOR-1 bacterium RIFOXYA12_FULL_43_27]OGC20840.1 MAG: hypothetical protein A2292_07455 [candidate division WOR-1 bacterium RIFOXYB2_FULL_46_45]OGC31423.1 MAG: hypothetical protein A2232_03995 [candidate division WOR-1 bacterium RIFOXYA2_FULL_46_56]OGC39829.1 MAG: hypothetical protein A2438_04830 [candidate division WOR-1 bacterium RIFOXYC2_FULL_46_14]
MKKILGLLVFLLVIGSMAMAELPMFYGEEIVVTATRLPRRIFDQPWSSRVFTNKEIRDSGKLNVTELLQHTCGVEMTTQGFFGSVGSAHLRGGTAQQTLILLDGRRINSPTLGSCDLSTIPLDNVERVEVVKTPLSAIYGSDAVGGVINIISKKKDEKRKTTFSLEQGSYSLGNYTLQTSGPNYNVSLNSIYSAGYRANGDYKGENYSASVSSGDFSLNLLRNQNQSGSPYYITYPSLTSRNGNENSYIDLLYSGSADGIRARPYLNILESLYQDPSFFTNDRHLTRTYGFELSKNINGASFGLDLSRDVSESTKSEKHNINRGAAYVEFNQGSVYVGARQDLSSNFASQFSPRVGAVFHPREDLALKASLAGAYRTPTINDLYWKQETFTYVYPDLSTYTYTTIGNPNLKPELGRSLDLSVEKKMAGAELKASYYLNEIENMIRWDNVFGATSSTYTPQNVANARINGLELEAVGNINEYCRLFANYNWQDSQNVTSGKVMDYSPKNKYNLGVAFDNRAMLLSALQRFVGERYADLANTQKLDGYSVTDLLAIRRLNNFNLKFKLDNLFDLVYYEQFGYPSAGRTFSVGVEFNG